MKAYSLDLRQKVVNLYEEGNISQRQLAKQFNVALSFVQKMLRQKLELGHIEPKIRREQTPTKLNQEQLAILEQLVTDNNDATLAELREMLFQKTGVMIGRSTVDRMLSKLNITVKKRMRHGRVSRPCGRTKQNSTPDRKRNRPSSTTAGRILAIDSRHSG
jgi:transposase